MQPDYLLNNSGDIQQWKQCLPLPVADPLLLEFCQSLSDKLMAQQTYSELTALGFWLRRANLKLMLERHLPTANLAAIGHVMHVTPNNVDSMFVYSWCCSLLMGNCNVVRVSQQQNPVKVALLQAIDELFEQAAFSPIAARNLFVSYPRDSQLSEQLSKVSDARVIWGGDDSVKAIRALAAKPATRDIAFGHRWSACVIDAQSLDEASLPKVAERLWRDAYPHGQQACSSPQVVFWLGEQTHQKRLFEHVSELAAVQQRQMTAANEHLVASQWLLATQASEVVFRQEITAVNVETVQPGLCSDGFFQVVNLSQIRQLAEHINERLQTLSYFGAKSMLLGFNEQARVDRIVPLGQALAFSPIWDGYNLFAELTRQVVYE